MNRFPPKKQPQIEPDADDRGGPMDGDTDDKMAKRKKLAAMVAMGGKK